MNKIKKFISNNIPKLSFLLFFIINLLILTKSNYIDGGDDLFFYESSLKYSIKDFLIHRYNNWSGRVIPDFLALLFNNQLKNIWTIVNSIMMTLLGILFYQYFLILNPKINQLKRKIIAPSVCLSFLFINRSIISPSFIWLTGSINYLWPIVLFLIIFYPYFFYIINKYYPKNGYYFILLSFIGGILTEQISVMFILLLSLFLIYFFFTQKKIPYQFLISSLLIFLGSILLFFAPGNQIRYQSEVVNNFPSFNSLSILNHISISIYWILNKITNTLSLTLIPIYLLVGINNYRNKKNISINFLLLIISLVLIVKNILKLEFKIYPITSDNIFSTMNIVYYLLITFSFLLLPFSIVKNIKNNFKKYFYSITFFLLFILMFMTTLSPTLDVSGNRTLFIPSLLLTFTWISLIFQD